MKRIGLILVVLLSFLLTNVSYGQQSPKLEIVQDSMILLLQEFRAEHVINPINARTTVSLAEKKVDKRTAKRVRTKGFRVQIFSGSNRSDAVAAQNSFLRQYKEMGAYLSFEEPNYRVKVGDFRTRSEANAFLQKIRGRYQNVFVFVEDVWVWQ